MIVVQNLKKYYGKNVGIEDVSLEVKEGEILGLIGPNGAGKTTTIRILMGFLSPDAGKALISGKSMPKEIDFVKKNLGYIPGEVNFYGDMKIKEFLKFNRAFYKKIDLKYERYIVETLGIDLNKKFKELSLGNKKKVAILQALVHKPKYLILDEPTSGLDPIIQQKFYKLLDKHKKNRAVILFSSHILSEVEKLCDKFAMIKDGKIIMSGEISKLRDISIKQVHIYGLNFCNSLEKYPYKKEDMDYIFEIKQSQMKEFLKEILNCEFKDIEIKNQALEDIFLKMYRWW